MYSVMHAFNNHVRVLRNVTPIDGRIYKSAPTTQSAVLSDGVVVAALNNQYIHPSNYDTGRGGLTCPPAMRYLCTNSTALRHQIMVAICRVLARI